MKYSLVCGLTRSSNSRPVFLFLLCNLFILILLISGCSSHPKGPPSRGVMDQNRFVDLLVDIHYYEGIYSATQTPESYHLDIEHDTVDYYQGVFEKHGVTREEFQKSLIYYSYNPSQFERLYNRVIDDLNKKIIEADIKELELQEQSSADQTVAVESENIWNTSENWFFPGPDTNRMISFKIPARGPGKYTFTADIQLDRRDIAEDPRVSLWFWYDDGTEHGYRENFTPFSLNKDGRTRKVTVAGVLTNPDVTHVKGRVLDLSNPDDTGDRHAIVSDIRLLFSEEPDPERL